MGYGGNPQCQGQAFLLLAFCKENGSLQRLLSHMPTVCGQMQMLMMKKEKEEERMLTRSILYRNSRLFNTTAKSKQEAARVAVIQRRRALYAETWAAEFQPRPDEAA